MKDERGIAHNADMQPGSGSWDLFTRVYGAWQPGSRPAGPLLHLLPEIPVYSRVNGIQLSPTFRIQAGLYILLTGRQKMENQNNYQL